MIEVGSHKLYNHLELDLTGIKLRSNSKASTIALSEDGRYPLAGVRTDVDCLNLEYAVASTPMKSNCGVD